MLMAMMMIIWRLPQHVEAAKNCKAAAEEDKHPADDGEAANEIDAAKNSDAIEDGETSSSRLRAS